MKRLLSFTIALAGLLSPAQAAWVTQSISLRPGWNAIHFQVDPVNRGVADVFSGIPIKSVWRWNEVFSSVRYIQDVNILLPKAPGWFTYLPPVNGAAAVNNLNSIDGGRTYLVHLDGTASVTLQVKGEPVARPQSWISDSYNLVGFKVDPANQPTLSQYFANAPAHTDRPIYRMQASGQWLAVNPATELANPGEAFWVYTKGQSTFDGFVKAQSEQRSTLEFGTRLIEQTLILKNEHNAGQTVTLAFSGSENPPTNAGENLGGPVALSVWKQNVGGGQYGWSPVAGPLSFTLAPGTELPVRLAVRRPDFALAPPKAVFRSVLKISSSGGSNILMPVRAERDTSAAGLRTGLWVGSVNVNKVNQPAHATTPTLPRATGSEASFRIILHVDHAGAVRLLSQVNLMWKDGQKDPSGQVTVPGHYALLTDESLIPQFSGSTLRDGRQVARRISTVAFGFSQPVLFTGNFGGTINGTVAMGYNDPLNPFKHRYHPDHDNKDARFENLLPEGKESFTINRALQLQFSPTDPEGLAIAGWGDSAYGGSFSETITGIHRNPLKVEGTFRLSRITDVGVLNQ